MESFIDYCASVDYQQNPRDTWEHQQCKIDKLIEALEFYNAPFVNISRDSKTEGTWEHDNGKVAKRALSEIINSGRR